MGEVNYKGTYYLLRLQFAEEKYPLLLDISSLLYDLELTYDFGVILTEEEYLEYKFSSDFWYRAGRNIRPYHQIRTARITKESPLILEIILGSLGGLWGLMQMIEKVSNWRLNREKLRLEVEKLRDEKELRRIELLAGDEWVELLAERRGAMNEARSLIARLNRSPLTLQELELKRVELDDTSKSQM